MLRENNCRGAWRKAFKSLLINYQILLPNFLIFSCEWLGEFNIASKVTKALFHIPLQLYCVHACVPFITSKFPRISTLALCLLFLLFEVVILWNENRSTDRRKGYKTYFQGSKNVSYWCIGAPYSKYDSSTAKNKKQEIQFSEYVTALKHLKNSFVEF